MHPHEIINLLSEAFTYNSPEFMNPGADQAPWICFFCGGILNLHRKYEHTEGVTCVGSVGILQHYGGHFECQPMITLCLLSHCILEKNNTNAIARKLVN